MGGLVLFLLLEIEVRVSSVTTPGREAAEDGAPGTGSRGPVTSRLRAFPRGPKRSRLSSPLRVTRRPRSVLPVASSLLTLTEVTSPCDALCVGHRCLG